MDRCIEEIIEIVLAEPNEYIRKYDLKKVLEDYTEREIDRRVAAYIEEEKEEAWSNGYTQGKRETIECMRDNFEEMLYSI